MTTPTSTEKTDRSVSISEEIDPRYAAQVEKAHRELETDGITTLENIISPEQFEGMQRAFEAHLRRMRWNNIDGYERTERFRHMVEDVLVIDQGFVDAALHPIVKEVLKRYIGPTFTLDEAKGWKSLATKRDFHVWHGDMWYDKLAVDFIPREVKLVIYLTEVRTGAFSYFKGTHRKEPPRDYEDHEITPELAARNIEMTGPAGTAVMFDTSGIHRQGTPILEPRNAVFLNYHDPTVKIQEGDLISYRYHPLILNAAFLGNLSAEDQRILGFGEQAQYRPAYVGKSAFETSGKVFQSIHVINLFWQDFSGRVLSRLRRLAGK
jgi:hypothetical protein